MACAERSRIIRVNRGVIKYLYTHGIDLNAYRLYTIARIRFADRSGIFSLNEFCDILHFEYGYKSLHHGAGNDRYRFQKKLRTLFQQSQLFSFLDDGRCRIRSERTLLFESHAKRSGWYELPEDSYPILTSRRKFTDFCIGSLLAGNKFRANENISTYCGCTVRRIQYATSRNHKSSTYHKQYNYVEVKTGTYEEVMRERAILLSEHGITSPLPKRSSKREWVLRLNAPNTYRALVLSGVKGHKAQPTAKTICKENRWFIPVQELDKQKTLFCDETPRRWVFNERNYHIGRYVLDHSCQFKGGSKLSGLEQKRR